MEKSLDFRKPQSSSFLLARLSVFLLGMALLIPRVSAAERSVYTSVEKNCRDATYLKQPARDCAGVRGWRLLVVSEMERSYVVLRRRGYEKDLRDDIFSERIGQFPEIRATVPVEWRIGAGDQPRALIFRVFAVNPNKSLQADPNPYRSSLLVVRLGTTACSLGVVNDNESARLLADSEKVCD